MVVNILVTLALLSVANCDYCKDQKWNYYKAEHKYIKLLPDRTDWTRGYEQCRRNNGDLLIIKDVGLVNFLKSITINQDKYYWIGLRTFQDANRVQWLDGSKQDTASNDHGCALISLEKKEFGSLDLKDCTSKYMSICQSHDPCGPRPVLSIMNKRSLIDTIIWKIKGYNLYTLICHVAGNQDKAAILYFSCKGRRKTSKDKVDLTYRFLGTAIDKSQCTCSLLRTDRNLLVTGVRFTTEDSFRDEKFKKDEIFVKTPGEYFEAHLWRNGSFNLNGVLTKNGKNVSNLLDLETRPNRLIFKTDKVEESHSGCYLYLIRYPSGAIIEYGFVIVVITAPFQLAPGEDSVQKIQRTFGKGVTIKVNIFGRTDPRSIKLYRNGVQMSKKLYTFRYFEQMKTMGSITLNIPGAVQDGSYKLAIKSRDGYSLDYQFIFSNLKVPFRIIQSSSETHTYNGKFGQGFKVTINITGNPDPKGYTLTRNDVTVATDTYSVKHMEKHVAKTFQTGIVLLDIFDVVKDGPYALEMKDTSGKKIKYSFRFQNMDVPFHLLTDFYEDQMYNSVDAIARGINISVSGALDQEGFQLTRNGFEVKKKDYNLTYVEGIFPNGTITIQLSEFSKNGFYKLIIKDEWGQSIVYDFYYNSMSGGQDSRHFSAAGLLIRGVLAISILVMISVGMFIISVNWRETLPLRSSIERGVVVQAKPDESNVGGENQVQAKPDESNVGGENQTPTHKEEVPGVSHESVL